VRQPIKKGKSKGKSQKAKVKSKSGVSHVPHGETLEPATGKMAASKLVCMLEALKNEKRQLESTIAAIETAKRKRKAGPEPPVSVN
jgi:hypothetical protein